MSSSPFTNMPVQIPTVMTVPPDVNTPDVKDTILFVFQLCIIVVLFYFIMTKVTYKSAESWKNKKVFAMRSLYACLAALPFIGINYLRVYEYDTYKSIKRKVRNIIMPEYMKIAKYKNELESTMKDSDKFCQDKNVQLDEISATIASETITFNSYSDLTDRIYKILNALNAKKNEQKYALSTLVIEYNISREKIQELSTFTNSMFENTIKTCNNAENRCTELIGMLQSKRSDQEQKARELDLIDREKELKRYKSEIITILTENNAFCNEKIVSIKDVQSKEIANEETRTILLDGLKQIVGNATEHLQNTINRVNNLTASLSEKNREWAEHARMYDQDIVVLNNNLNCATRVGTLANIAYDTIKTRPITP
jgi:hypothetical protein